MIGSSRGKSERKPLCDVDFSFLLTLHYIVDTVLWEELIVTYGTHVSQRDRRCVVVDLEHFDLRVLSKMIHDVHQIRRLGYVHSVRSKRHRRWKILDLGTHCLVVLDSQCIDMSIRGMFRSVMKCCVQITLCDEENLSISAQTQILASYLLFWNRS